MAASTPLDFDVESFINEHYIVWGGTDEELILSYYGDNIVLQIPGLLMEGKEALRDQFVRPFITAFPGNHHLVKNMIFGPGVVTVEFILEARHTGPFAGHEATGARISLPGCGVYEYDSAKRQITAGRIYFDLGTLLQTITDPLAEDRKRSEEVLHSNDRNLSLIINTIPAHIYVLNTEGYVRYVNQAVVDYTGLSMEDVHQEDYRDRVIHPDDFKRVREPRAAGLRRGAPFSTEQRVLGNDGQYRWFLVRYRPLRDELGRIDRWYVAAFDIEDLKRAEMEVEQAHAQLTEAQRLSQTGSFTWDVQHDDHKWSAEVYRIFEFEPGTKVTMQMIQSAIHPDDMPATAAVIGGAAEGADFDHVFRLVTASGAVKYAHAVGRRIEQIADRPVFMGAIHNITESKIAEEALNRARSELAHMARVTTLSELTASIAHEINQPIAATITNANACLRWLTRDVPNLEEVRSAVERIKKEGERTGDIIGRLRSMYKKESFAQRQLVDVNAIVSEMLVLLRSEANRHSIVTRTELVDDLPLIRADRVQLQQVLMNLMLNGIEAMEMTGGEMTIRTQLDGDNVLVSVSDTGVGLFGHNLDRIFDSFYTTKSRGTGMGLSISRSIIEAHGGRLWATNNDARGAIFYFTLPAVKA